MCVLPPLHTSELKPQVADCLLGFPPGVSPDLLASPLPELAFHPSLSRPSESTVLSQRSVVPQSSQVDTGVACESVPFCGLCFSLPCEVCVGVLPVTFLCLRASSASDQASGPASGGAACRPGGPWPSHLARALVMAPSGVCCCLSFFRTFGIEGWRGPLWVVRRPPDLPRAPW